MLCAALNLVDVWPRGHLGNTFRQHWVYDSRAPTVKNAFPFHPVPQTPSTCRRQLMLTNFLCVLSAEFYVSMHICYATLFSFFGPTGDHIVLHFAFLTLYLEDPISMLEPTPPF